MTISTPPAPAGPCPRRPRRMRDELRELTVRLHFLAGLFIAPFLLVTAVTGVLYALTPQIEQMVYAEELHATTCAQAEATPLAQQVRAGQAAVPDGTVAEIRPAPEAGSTARVSFESPSAPEDRRLTTFVDPCTGEVTGVLPTFGEWLPLRTWFDDLHRNLHLGDAGRWYSEVAASWLWVLALSGLAVWLTRKRRKRSLRALLLAQRTGPRRQRAVSLHATLGVWAALGLFFLSATGLTWSQYAGGNVGALRQSLDWSTPSVSTQAHAGAPVAPVGEQRVPEVAQHMLEDSRAHGLADPVAITPGADGGAWVVSQVQRSWPLQQDSVSLDPATGQVLDSVRFEDWPVAAKFAEAGISFHMGILFGWVNQLVLIGIAAAAIVLIVLGARLWWRRRPPAPDRGLPRPLGRPGRSAGAYGIMLAVAALAGLALPLLGLTLVLFLALDLARQLLLARRTSGRGRRAPNLEP